MSIAEAILQEVSALPPEKQEQLLSFAKFLRQQPAAVTNSEPTRSYYGVLAGKGPVPSIEDIREVRQEMWANFPDEDI